MCGLYVLKAGYRPKKNYFDMKDSINGVARAACEALEMPPSRLIDSGPCALGAYWI